MQYKVLITTSGTGSRLGDLTKDTNKALVDVSGQTTIDRIIGMYGVDTEFVVTLGYYGDKVKQHLLSQHPDRTFTFALVDKFVGEGSSLGYSMLQAREHLQCPFIFHATDTLVTGEVPTGVKNWIGVYKSADATQYSSWKIGENGELLFQGRDAKDADFIHIGLIGISDYKMYWDELAALYASNPNDQSLNDCKVLVQMIQNGVTFELVEFFDWCDTGNLPALEKTRHYFSSVKQ